MPDWPVNPFLGFLQQSRWEFLAVALAIAYVLLAVREHLWCWYAAFLSTFIYTLLFWKVSLLMESALNVFYMIMAVYGWWHWRYGSQPRQQGTENTEVLSISRWTKTQHAIALLAIAFTTAISGYLLERNTGAALPWLDSFTTWASVVTTFMVARKVLENWLYWIVIDAASIYLYLQRELFQTALLFVIYTIMAVIGFITWQRHYRDSHVETAL